MKIFLAVFVIIAITNTSCTAQPPSTLKIVFIRHGEKPDKGDNLTCKGLNRALALPDVLYKKFNVPDKIFVPAVENGKSTNESRMFQTISPFAIKYNLNIDTRFNVKDAKGIADELLKSKGYELVVWEHDKIVSIVKALGVSNNNLHWSDNDFDSIWIVTFKDGVAMLSVDKENLDPASVCQ